MKQILLVMALRRNRLILLQTGRIVKCNPILLMNALNLTVQILYILTLSSQAYVEISNAIVQKSLNLEHNIFIYVMCGRTCLSLEPNDICKAAAYKSPTNSNEEITKFKLPEWRNEYNCGREYKPSYNLAPTDISPVLISAAHFDLDTDSEDRYFHDQNEKRDGNMMTYNSSDQLLVPMQWGMIPFWHKSSLDYRKHGLTTNNCRLESMLESKLYKRAFNKGQRCIVLCEGFYEWQTTDSTATKPSQRAAYYIYMPQSTGIQIEIADTWRTSVENVRLLKMAGLFDIWTNDKGEQIYSYSVITFESDDTLNWLHHRSPAILDSDEACADWIDFKRVTDTNYLLSLLKPIKCLQWHRVSNMVNNARNKSDQCNTRLENAEKSKTNPLKRKMLESWLIRKQKPS